MNPNKLIDFISQVTDCNVLASTDDEYIAVLEEVLFCAQQVLEEPTKENYLELKEAVAIAETYE